MNLQCERANKILFPWILQRQLLLDNKLFYSKTSYNIIIISDGGFAKNYVAFP